MEIKQEEQARQMADLPSRADHLQQENDRLRARMEGERLESERVRGGGAATLHPRLN